MSAESDSRLRTVTPLSGTHDLASMNAIGWIIFVIMGIILLPLLPVVALVWLVVKVLG